jgi:hypothetical protein
MITIINNDDDSEAQPRAMPSLQNVDGPFAGRDETSGSRERNSPSPCGTRGLGELHLASAPGIQGQQERRHLHSQRLRGSARQSR